MSYSYERIKDLKIGEEYFECSGRGGNKYFVVETTPIEKIMRDPVLNQLEWTAKNLEGEIKRFLITENLEHYGPKLYASPAYISFNQNELKL